MKLNRSIKDMDKVDKKILKILQDDGKATLSDISDKLRKLHKISLGKTAINARIEKMREGNNDSENIDDRPIIEKFMAVVNCRKIGYTEMLMASLRLNGSAKEIGAHVKKIEEVKYIYITSGEYPLFVMAKCFGHQESLDIVEKLQKIEGVEEVKTEIVMDCIKEDHTIHIK